MIPQAEPNLSWLWCLYLWHTGLFRCRGPWGVSPDRLVLRHPGLWTWLLGKGLQVHTERSISALGLFFSWQFTCTDLWETCVHHSMYLQPPLVDSPVLVHRIDLFPLSQETSGFYVDEIIIADTNITGDYRICSCQWAYQMLTPNFSARGCSSFNAEGTHASPSCLPWFWKDDAFRIVCPWSLSLSS